MPFKDRIAALDYHRLYYQSSDQRTKRRAYMKFRRVALAAQRDRSRVCDWCRRVFVYAPTGRPPRFCSPGCRVLNRGNNAETQARWRAAHLDQARLQSRSNEARRRADKRATAMGTVNYQKILEQYGLTCYLCQKVIAVSSLHFDHVVPLSRGGSHTADNIRPTHGTCNLRKGAKII